MNDKLIEIKPGFGENRQSLLKSFISVYASLPMHTCEVEIIRNNDFGTIGQCMFYEDFKGFGTYYKMLIEGVTHWRFKK